MKKDNTMEKEYITGKDSKVENKDKNEKINNIEDTGAERKNAVKDAGGIKTEKQTAIQVSVVSIVVNLLLSAAKLAAGIIGRSQAMLSDAVHSASDVFSTFIVIIGVNISSKASDEDHQYGHERMECVRCV